MRTGIALCVAFALAGCGHTREPVAEITDSAPTATPRFTKSAFIPEFAESSPIEVNGVPYVISFEKIHRFALAVRDLAGTEISAKPWDRSFGCAFVEGARTFVFSSDEPTHTDISMRHSDDLINWSADAAVIHADVKNLGLWNCSVIKDGDSYLMAYEVSGEGIRGFSFRIARSADMHTWTDEGRLFSRHYSACPTLRKIGAFYYVIYLEEFDGGWRTRAARTRDFINYDRAGTVLLQAESGEGSNASDVDLVEMNGETVLTYGTGNQTTWGDTKLARYAGTMAELLTSLWP